MTRWAKFEDPVEWFCAARLAYYQSRTRYAWYCLFMWQLTTPGHVRARRTTVQNTQDSPPSGGF